MEGGLGTDEIKRALGLECTLTGDYFGYSCYNNLLQLKHVVGAIAVANFHSFWLWVTSLLLALLLLILMMLLLTRSYLLLPLLLHTFVVVANKESVLLFPFLFRLCGQKGLRWSVVLQMWNLGHLSSRNTCAVLYTEDI